MFSLSELLAEYALFARAADYSPQTIEWYAKYVALFERYLDAQGHSTACEDITARIIRAYVVDLRERVAPHTLLNAVQALKTLFAFGVREELLDEDPTLRIPKPKLPEREYPVFEPTDVDALLRACDTQRLTGLRDFAIVTLLFDSGIRASELTGLSEDAIDWQRGLIRVFGKGAKERRVPVSSHTLRVLRRYLTAKRKRGPGDSGCLFVNDVGAPLSYTALIQALRRLGKRTGLHVHPHKFRHSFAVNALRNGAREFDIQGCLGHTTLTMTRHYARQTGEDLADAHRRFSLASSLRVRG